MVKNLAVTDTREIEIRVIGEIEDGVRITFGAVIDREGIVFKCIGNRK